MLRIFQGVIRLIIIIIDVFYEDFLENSYVR